MKKSSYIILGIIIIIIGIVTLLGGVFYKINYNDKYKGYSKVISAKVVSSIVKSERKKDITGVTSTYYVYAPVLEYQVRGKTYRYASNKYDVTKPKVNDKIKIVVNNNNPKDIKIVIKDFTLVLIIVGSIITIYGLVLIIFHLKLPKKETIKEHVDIKETEIKDEKPENNKKGNKKESTTETIEILESEIEEDII